MKWRNKNMQSQDAINYLENLEKENFLTINIPIFKDKIQPVTVMYVGKDSEGRYNFIDSGTFKMSKEFLEKGAVTIDREYDGDIAIDIHTKFKINQEKKQKHKVIEIIDKFIHYM